MLSKIKTIAFGHNKISFIDDAGKIFSYDADGRHYHEMIDPMTIVYGVYDLRYEIDFDLMININFGIMFDTYFQIYDGTYIYTFQQMPVRNIIDREIRHFTVRCDSFEGVIIYTTPKDCYTLIANGEPKLFNEKNTTEHINDTPTPVKLVDKYKELYLKAKAEKESKFSDTFQAFMEKHIQPYVEQGDETVYSTPSDIKAFFGEQYSESMFDYEIVKSGIKYESDREALVLKFYGWGNCK